MAIYKRKKKSGIKSNQDKLRLSVFRSHLNMYLQIIDDTDGKTVVSASTLKLDKSLNSSDRIKLMAEKLSIKAKEKKITKLIFDRGNFIYKGQIKLVADALRSNGMEF
jgi:large subunit ribosomal protein L18